MTLTNCEECLTKQVGEQVSLEQAFLKCFQEGPCEESLKGLGRNLHDEAPADESDVYSWEWQVAGLFLVFTVSLLGALGSFALAKRKSQVSQSGMALETTVLILKGLGSGVMISTALIHLINEAYSSFEEVGWSETYEATPMVFAMISLLGMSILDFVVGKYNFTATSPENSDSTSAEDESDLRIVDTEKNGGALRQLEQHHIHHVSARLEMKKFTAMIVEVSILMHSVLIGLDLGLQNKSNWNTLVVAVCFHQFFEGLALGQVIFEAGYKNKWHSIVQLLSFAGSTTVGIVIGIAIREIAGSENVSRGVTILIGVLNSLCGGILLYTGIVHCLLLWFVQNDTLYFQSNSVALVSFFAVAVGMSVMALIGFWA